MISSEKTTAKQESSPSQDSKQQAGSGKKGQLVRIEFEGIVADHKIYDEIVVHAAGAKEAKEIFSRWISKVDGIRGCHCFHPLAGYGDIKIKKAVELGITYPLVVPAGEKCETQPE